MHPWHFLLLFCCTIIKIQVSWTSPGNIVCRETWQASQLPPLEHDGARKISKLLKKEVVEHYSLISWSWGGFTLLARGARWPKTIFGGALPPLSAMKNSCIKNKTVIYLSFQPFLSIAKCQMKIFILIYFPIFKSMTSLP